MDGFKKEEILPYITNDLFEDVLNNKNNIRH